MAPGGSVSFCTHRPESFFYFVMKKGRHRQYYISDKKSELASKSDTIGVKILVWKFVIIFPPRLLIVQERKKSVSILHCSIHGTSKVFSLNPCYVLLRCCSTCVITFSDDKLTICNLSWLRIMWSLCYMNIYSYSSVLCCYYVYYGSSLFQVPLFLTKANTLLERLVVRKSFNKHDTPCWPLFVQR